MHVLVTGAAGFIGFHVAKALLARGDTVVGVDNLNNYYDVNLKQSRLQILRADIGFKLHLADISAPESILPLASEGFTHIVHLAAQAGVRYSLENPLVYAESNMTGQVVMLELARKCPGLQHFIYASSSSVYGGNQKIPFSIDDAVNRPISLYAATKRAGELMGYTYAHLFGISMTGLRFFTVYGPWGRPDMAAYIFTRQILAEQPIKVFNHGKMRRDFTYIDDIVKGVLACLEKPAVARAGQAPSALYNLGNSRSENLLDFITCLEKALGKKAIIDFQPIQPGDVPETYADIATSTRDFGYAPTTHIEEGTAHFVKWFRAYHNV